ncbi:MAG: hypothetical protein QM820_39975 [Minicystis sp.]
MSPVAAWAQPAKAADDEATALDKAAMAAHLAGDEAAARKKLGRAIFGNPAMTGARRRSRRASISQSGHRLIVQGGAPDDGAANWKKALTIESHRGDG